MAKFIVFDKLFAISRFMAVAAMIFFPLYLAGRPLILPASQDLQRTERRAALEQYYNRIIQPNTDLEAFARLSEWAAKQDVADDYGKRVDVYLDDLSWLIMGSPDSLTGILYGGGGRLLESLHNRTGIGQGYPVIKRFGGSGFRFSDKSNQVQHFWFSVILAYHGGAELADGFARYHEWNAPTALNWLPLTGHGEGTEGDLALSRQAIRLGLDLRQGKIQPSEVAGWIRANL